jgi:hypothetical protein
MGWTGVGENSIFLVEKRIDGIIPFFILFSKDDNKQRLMAWVEVCPDR